MSGMMTVALLCIVAAVILKVVGIGGQKWAYARTIFALTGGLFLLGTSVLGAVTSASSALGTSFGLVLGFGVMLFSILLVVKDFKEDGKGDWRAIVCGTMTPILVAAFFAPALNTFQSNADNIPQSVQRMFAGFNG